MFLYLPPTKVSNLIHSYFKCVSPHPKASASEFFALINSYAVNGIIHCPLYRRSNKSNWLHIKENNNSNVYSNENVSICLLEFTKFVSFEISTSFRLKSIRFHNYGRQRVMSSLGRSLTCIST